MQAMSLNLTRMFVSRSADDAAARVVATGGVATACGAADGAAGACVAAGAGWGVVHPAAEARRRMSSANSTQYPGIFMMLNAEESHILVTIYIRYSGPFLPAVRSFGARLSRNTGVHQPLPGEKLLCAQQPTFLHARLSGREKRGFR